VARWLTRVPACLFAVALLLTGTLLVAAAVLAHLAPHLLERWAPEPVAALPGLLPWLPVTAGAVGLLFAGVGLRLPRGSRENPVGQVAALCLAAALFQLLLLHPAQSALRSPVPFYRAARPLVANRAVAVYGRLDFSPHWALGRVRVAELGEPPVPPPGAGPRRPRSWLIAEGPEVDRLGWPRGYQAALVVERHQDTPLLLLAPLPESAREAGRPASLPPGAPRVGGEARTAAPREPLPAR